MSVNKALILGRVGKDPQVSHINDTKKVSHINDTKKVSFSMATTDRAYTTKAGVNVPEKTEWHNIVAWRNLAEICEKYVHKGDLLYIEGKITNRSWEKDGTTHYITEIVAEVVELFPKNQQQSNPNPNPQADKVWEPVLTPINDDEPF